MLFWWHEKGGERKMKVPKPEDIVYKCPVPDCDGKLKKWMGKDTFLCKKSLKTDTIHVLVLRLKSPLDNFEDPVEWINIVDKKTKYPVKYKK
jgi:hypothetical protein